MSEKPDIYELKKMINQGVPVSKIVEHFNGFYTYDFIKKEIETLKGKTNDHK